MRIVGSPLRRAVVAATAGVVLAGWLMGAPAHAAEPASPQAAASLVAKLGDRTAGMYGNDQGRIVVTVTDQAAARRVRANGAIAKIVQYGSDDLARAKADLDRSVTFPGTSWWTDPISNKVVVSADRTVTAAQRDRLRAVASRHPGLIRTEFDVAGIQPTISGGDPIYTPGHRCSLAFNVVYNGNYYALTAGHCTNVSQVWYGSQDLSGPSGNVVVSSFPGNDYGAIQYPAGVKPEGNVNLYNGSYQDITRAADPYVGQKVTHSGFTSGTHSGKITAVDVTVLVDGRSKVTGMIRSDICSSSGDSGGALFSGSTALGILSSGRNFCWASSSPATIYQPVTEILKKYGASVY